MDELLRFQFHAYFNVENGVKWGRQRASRVGIASQLRLIPYTAQLPHSEGILSNNFASRQEVFRENSSSDIGATTEQDETLVRIAIAIRIEVERQIFQGFQDRARQGIERVGSQTRYFRLANEPVTPAEGC